MIVRAGYKNESGVPLNTHTTYIVDLRRNSVMTYNGYRGFSPSKIAFSPASENILITVKQDGTIAIYTPEAFSRYTFTNGMVFTFSVKEIDPATTSVGEMKKMMGL